MAIQVEVSDPEPTVVPGSSVGVDLGIRYRAVTSDGEFFANPKPGERYKRKLARMQRRLDKRLKEGSKNYRKQQARIAKLNARIANIRREHSHEMTTSIASRYEIVGVEDLNIRGMVKNRRIARAVSDAAMYQVRSQLEYKAAAAGGRTVKVSRWYASSKTCSRCKYKVKALPLDIRRWACPRCGTEHERDGNAAENIRSEAVRLVDTA